ncbi:GmrSD restriction endonuclease domain-containing protein [Nocardiopsis oceani]
MKASETPLLGLLYKSHQFVIPIYQRAYSWSVAECDQLMSDIERAGSDDELQSHFTGSIVHVEKGLSNLTTQEPDLVIDGQQRITTLTLLIAALARALDAFPDGEREPWSGFSPNKLRNRYLVNVDEEGEDYFRLLLSEKDRDTLKAIVHGNALPSAPSERVQQNYERFLDHLTKPGTDLAAVCRGLSKLVVVDIRLDRTYDNPQLIFESMNSTGLQLSQADLIRNFVLMGLKPSHQESLYNGYWRPMETDFGQAAYEEQFDSFVRHYLTVVTGEIPRLGDVYGAFKEYAKIHTAGGGTVDSLVQELRSYSSRYCAVALGHEADKELAEAFRDLREIKADVVYPLLLELYTDYQSMVLSRDELVSIVEMVTSYIFRRAVCRVPTNSLNRTFSTFTRSIDKGRYVQSVQTHLLGMKSYRAFPTDKDFTEKLTTGDMYSFKRRSYLLRRLENFGRKEHVSIEDYTIEHILPQNENLSQQWRNDLGAEWDSVHARYLHTLGNLTLTGYNSEYADLPFQLKQDMEGGFRESPLRLNRGLGSLETWDEQAIVERAERLAAQAVQIWPRPTPPEDVTATAQPAPESGYSIEDHPNLFRPGPRELFDKLRGEVMALDEAVTETFLKNYVAYKAETNFVDVVPQTERLKLTLNMPFEMLHDARGLATDVTGRGKWGNGNVQVELDTGSDLNHIMGLVRQAYEHQVGE